jgi:general stress protein 26
MTELTGTEATERLKALVEDIDFAMLTTQDARGNLVSRPMSTREMDPWGDIWFFTAEDTKKVAEAEEEHDVGLSYADAKRMRYVSIAGRASIVHDEDRMKALYTPSLDIWFEDGLETPGIALLKVTPVEAELWQPAHGKLVVAAGMLKSLFTKDTPDEEITDHARIVRS